MSNIIDVSEMFAQKIIQNNLSATQKEVERTRLITPYVKSRYRYWAFKTGKSLEQQAEKIKEEIQKRIDFSEQYEDGMYELIF